MVAAEVHGYAGIHARSEETVAVGNIDLCRKCMGSSINGRINPGNAAGEGLSRESVCCQCYRIIFLYPGIVHLGDSDVKLDRSNLLHYIYR